MGEEVKTENTEKKLNKPHLFQKGDDPRRNLEGRPKGALNFSTKWIKFIEKVAEQNETTADQVDEQMLKVAYKQIMSGDHRYWKDIMDRVYGQAKQPIEFDENITSIKVEIINGTQSESDTSLPQDKSEPGEDIA